MFCQAPDTLPVQNLARADTFVQLNRTAQRKQTNGGFRFYFWYFDTEHTHSRTPTTAKREFRIMKYTQCVSDSVYYFPLFLVSAVWLRAPLPCHAECRYFLIILNAARSSCEI